MLDGKSMGTPIDQNLIANVGKPTTPGRNQRLVNRLIYHSHTRSDEHSEDHAFVHSLCCIITILKQRTLTVLFIVICNLF